MNNLYDVPIQHRSMNCPYCDWNPANSDITTPLQHMIAEQMLTTHLLVHVVKELKSLNLATP